MNARVLIGMMALLTGCAAVPAALWWSTTERHTQGAADYLHGVATPEDLILVSLALETRAPNAGGLMRPFGPRAVTVLDPNGVMPDLPTFPQQRVFVVGDLPLEKMNVGNGKRVHQDVQELVLPHAGQPVVTLMDRLRISVDAGGTERPCTGRHPSGGVRCGAQGWQYVGPSVVNAQGKLVACLWAHPVAGSTMRVEIPTGQGDARLWLQFADEALKDAPHPPMDVVLAVGDAVLQQVACTNTGAGRCALDASLPAGTTALRLSISTSDAARQLVCLGGEVPRP